MHRTLRDVAMVEILYAIGAGVFSVTNKFSAEEKICVMVNGDIQIGRFVESLFDLL